MRRVFKRWVPMRSPPELYNHGFENLESLGGLYSRVSSHIFGDWNACGKVTGLAPWVGEWADDERHALLSGELDGELSLNWELLERLPHANGWRAIQRDANASRVAPNDAVEVGSDIRELRAFHTGLAASVQASLEGVVLPFLARLRQRTGATNLVLVGGVALNSVLNGR